MALDPRISGEYKAHWDARLEKVLEHIPRRRGRSDRKDGFYGVEGRHRYLVSVYAAAAASHCWHHRRTFHIYLVLGRSSRCLALDAPDLDLWAI